MDKKGILIIGAGGVSSVATFKCAMNIDTFKSISLASRTISKCENIAKTIKDKIDVNIDVYSVNANNINELISLINKLNVKVVLNVALPYQDLTIMDACIATNTHYIDTANYEHPDLAKFEYKEQWAKDEEFKKANITALLGSGFDPGVTGVFCSYADEYLFDTIEHLGETDDILNQSFITVIKHSYNDYTNNNCRIAFNCYIKNNRDPVSTIMELIG